jgi:hypothetical protein
MKNPADKLFSDIFTPDELTDIRENNIQVRFISESIHLDDTIEIIKKKLLFHLMDLNISFDELYFFIGQREQFKATTIYKNLTQNEKLELTKERLIQFLRNVADFDVTLIPDKETYSYDDILALNLEQAEFTLFKPLGQKFVSVKDDYPYTVNPYSAEFYDKFLEKFADKMITTTDKNILMEQGLILKNTIYLCVAEDILTFVQDHNPLLDISSTLKIYFPYLYRKDIVSLDQLIERKQELLGDTKNILTTTFEKNIENINLFYDIYHDRKEDMNFKDVGIKSLNLVIHQTTPIHLPLANVFKLIHATQDVPFIKMNLSKRQEKIYRFYADKIATNGKKIPYLDKGTIFKWDKEMSRGKSVTVFIEHQEKETSLKTPILCEFNSDGSIVITANFHTSLTPDAVTELFKTEVNPVIDVVKDYLAQDGYTLNNFVDLKTHEILSMEFAMNIDISKDINLKNIVGCLTSIFTIVNDNLDKGIMLRFKRVSNYNEMENQEALILDMTQPHAGYSDTDIIKVLQANFQLSEKDAIEKYAEVKRAQDLMLSGNKRMKKKNNPGFLTSIIKQPHTKTVMINVSGINNIGYLEIIMIYLDTLMRITQKKTTADKKIKLLCSGKKVEDEEQIPEITAPITENLQMTIVNEELVFNSANEIDQTNEATADAEELDEAAIANLIAQFGYEETDEGENVIEPPLEEGGGEGDDEEEEEEDEESPGEVPATAPQEPVKVDKSPEEDDEALEEDLETDITGQSLGNPSPFEKRMRKYDKSLFVTDTGKKEFSSYATDCQMNRRRQPIVLTKEEKERIDEEHPGSYSESIKYSSDPNKELWYICPRYWDMKNNTSLTEAEVDKNLVIPKNPTGKKVPPGKYIFEFNDYGPEHLANNKYITHYPGFLTSPHEERGACLPCCFKKWGGPIQAGIRAQCTKDETIVIPAGRKKKKAAEEIDEYILAPDKFPITQENRFGYLPIAVQKFLRTDNKKCQISDMNANLKQDHECLLRHSVEINSNQSFIACIADIWFETYANKEKVKPTIKRMKELFIENLTIDTFVTLQNGNLIKIFYLQSDDTDDIEKYADVYSKNDSKFYQIADKTKPDQMSALVKIARAYANFIAYLKDDSAKIDYEYIWDLICKPNPKLFPNGINLVIIELARKDITDNVELICPSNHYSSSFFDAKKSAILILKIDNYYEPIYTYKTNADEITINRTFNIMDNKVMPNIKDVLELIKESFNTKCPALPSMPLVYKFKKNIPLEKLDQRLKTINYSIEKQVMSYDSKIIGVVAINNQDNTKGFVPCYPSAPIGGDIVYMDDAYMDTYENTKAFLINLYEKSKKKIPCKPTIKVVDDGLIVGILTATNQFVAINEPVQDTFGNDLKITKNANYNEIDATLSTTKTVDIDRVNYIKNIQLETKFYNGFRTTARYLLGQYQNNDIRREIEEKIASTQLYLKKLRSIEILLRELMKNSIQFHDYTKEDLLNLTTITNCYNNCENKSYCQVNDEECSLLIPATNLINQKSNDTFYYGKLADEIVRYSRIKNFIFNPKSVLSFSQLNYNLRENEIILLQSLLTQEYFENVIASRINQYIKYNSYDTTQPIISQNYSNVAEEQAKTTTANDKCSFKTKDHISNGFWKAAFPIGSTEIIHSSTPPTCSFNAILSIIRDYTKEDLTVNQIKEVLLNDYLLLYENYNKQLLQILRAQGKKVFTKQIIDNQLSLADMIVNESYYASLLDVWVLVIHYNIPLVFISDSSLMENNARFMVAHSSADQIYYFLKVSATESHIAPIFTLILAGGSMKIDVGAIQADDIQTELRGTVSDNNLNEFIEKFSLTEANSRKKPIKNSVPITNVAVTVPVPVPSVPEPVVPEPVVPAQALPEPTVPLSKPKKTRKSKKTVVVVEPVVPEPVVPDPEPVVPAQATPEPAMPEPAMPEPAMPEPVISPKQPVNKIQKKIKLAK